MSDEQLSVFRAYGLETPDNIDELRRQLSEAKPQEGGGDEEPIGSNEPSGDGGEDIQDGDAPKEQSVDGDQPSGGDGDEPLEPADDNGLSELQKKERNGELTKREARKLEAVRRQQRDIEEKRQLNDKILGLEQKISELQGNSVKQTDDLLAKYFGKAGLLDNPANAAQNNGRPQTQDTAVDGGLETRLAQLEQLLINRERQTQMETAAREREKDVAALSELAPGIKTMEDVQRLDKFPQILQIMQTQVSSGMPRDIKMAYAMAYQDEIVEREIQRRVESQNKIERADARSKSSVTSSHLKGLPNAAAHESAITPQMRQIAGKYGFETDEEIRELYKDQLMVG